MALGWSSKNRVISCSGSSTMMVGTFPGTLCGGSSANSESVSISVVDPSHSSSSSSQPSSPSSASSDSSSVDPSPEATSVSESELSSSLSEMNWKNYSLWFVPCQKFAFEVQSKCSSANLESVAVLSLLLQLLLQALLRPHPHCNKCHAVKWGVMQINRCLSNHYLRSEASSEVLFSACEAPKFLSVHSSSSISLRASSSEAKSTEFSNSTLSGVVPRSSISAKSC